MATSPPDPTSDFVKEVLIGIIQTLAGTGHLPHGVTRMILEESEENLSQRSPDQASIIASTAAEFRAALELAGTNRSEATNSSHMAHYAALIASRCSMALAASSLMSTPEARACADDMRRIAQIARETGDITSYEEFETLAAQMPGI